jgi:hypothetical protein
MKERDEHLNQLTGYQEYSQLKQELTDELESMREFLHLKEFPFETVRSSPPLHHSPHSHSGHNRNNTPRKRTKRPTPGPSSSSGQQTHHSGITIRNIIEKHGLWCGIPSIRSLHPLLGEYIRQLYQDLHDTYTTLHTLQEDHQKLQEAQHETTIRGRQWQEESLKYSEKYLRVEEEERRREVQERERSRVSEEMRYVMVSAVQLMEKQNQQTFQLADGSKQQPPGRGGSKTKYAHAAASTTRVRESEPYEPIESDGSEEEEEEKREREDKRRRQGRGARREFHELREEEIKLEDLLDDDPTLLSSDRDEDMIFEQISSPIRRRGKKSEEAKVSSGLLLFIIDFSSFHSLLIPIHSSIRSITSLFLNCHPSSPNS